ncbi:MAG: glycosyltransferase family 2 protein [Pseudomonadota bacterium]
MPVLRRYIPAIDFGGRSYLGAVRQAGSILAWPSVTQGLRDRRVSFAETDLPGALPPELELLARRTVLVAFRTLERPEAVADWLAYHAARAGVDGALIVDRTEGGDEGFCAELKAKFPVVIVTSERPLGTHADGHGAVTEKAIADLLRHRFLAEARSVAFLGISDLLLPLDGGGCVFDRCVDNPDTVFPLRGVETYPWRLRQGAPAPHYDHVSSRRAERRRVISWAIAPGEQSKDAIWQTVAPIGLSTDDGRPAPFVRAMGVVHPGVSVNELVRKADLREQPRLVMLMGEAFGTDPLRLPAPAIIPPRPPGNALTVVTAMKNEGPFILDWVAHARAIGVANILAYSNDCGDGTDRLLSLLSDAGVTHRDNPYRQSGKVPQFAAFRAAEKEPLVRDADWLMTLDVDEYLNIHAGDGTLTDLLHAVPNAHVLSVPWRMFGNADRHVFEDRPVVEQFTRCAPEYAPRPLQAWAFKTLYRNAGLFRRMGVHRPNGMAMGYRDALNWVDATGTNLPSAVWDKAWRMSKAQWGYTFATLNHYAVRSAESFLVKRQRGKVNRTKREQGLAYWFRMNHNMVEDRSILRLSAKVAAEKEALLALPGVRSAHDEAVAWHRHRIAALRNDPDYASLFDEITSPRMQHLSRIATNFGANVHLIGPQVIPEEIAAHDPDVPFYWTVNLKA